ncbi:MAG: metallophosphoesterase [Clostridium sp.]|uniref:metallophosphoesterase n=1 Tax=Clostridium sp. TaxID=1506 RepID=UPI0032165899
MIDKLSIMAVMIPAVAIVGVPLYYDNNRLTTSRYNITSTKIPSAFEGFKILQLSDLHSKSFGKENHKLINDIDKENPDIIVMTGDMVNSRDNNFDIFINLAKIIAEKYEVYFVLGNNEQKLDNDKSDFLMKKLRQIGVKILNNRKVKLTKGDNTVNLYGMWFSLSYYRDMSSEYSKDIYFKEENMKNILGLCNDKEYNILLTHNPLYFDTYTKWGADLVIAGHVHGGLIRLPLLGGLLSPERKFFPKYSAGEYSIEGSKLILNTGLGSKIIIPRVFNRPEISVITLLSDNIL